MLSGADRVGLRALHSFQRGRLLCAVWVCAACVRDAAGRSDRGRAGGAGRSVAGAAAGCGAADPCMISPRRGALAACIRARAGCVLRRCQSVAAMWVWDSSQQVLATQGAVYVQGHCLQEQRIVYTSALLASARPSARAHDFP